jgi:hypothetical protein
MGLASLHPKAPLLARKKEKEKENERESERWD